MALLLRRFLTVAALVLAFGFCAAPARAQDDDEGGDPGMEALDSAYSKAERAILDKRYPEAIAAYEEFFKLLATSGLEEEMKRNAECGARYNLACAYALTDKKPEALQAFARAVELGFWDWDHIEKDTDLDPIRNEEGFKATIEKGKQLERAHAEEEAKQAAEEATAALAAEPLFEFDFSVTTVDGKTLKLADLKGKVVIVDVWGTWCPPCRAEIPHFIELYKRYKEKGLEIVGLACEQDMPLEQAPAHVREFAQKNGIPYPLAAIGGEDPILQTIPDFEAFPTTLWIDRDGKVRLKKVGYHDLAPLEGWTKALLEAPAKE